MVSLPTRFRGQFDPLHGGRHIPRMGDKRSTAEARRNSTGDKRRVVSLR
jgi:hypothetical protein